MNNKIVIIGAGASGIAAGTRLMENGFKNIIILEAENRIGGRINTIQFGKNVIDMGAQWCHGEKGNVVYELASKHNLLASNQLKLTSMPMVTSEGIDVPIEIGDGLLAMGLEISVFSKDDIANFKGSVGDFIVEAYTSTVHSPKFKHVDATLSQQFLEFFHKYQTTLTAADSWFDLSCRGFTEYIDCEGDPALHWKDKGYKTIFDLLMKKIPDATKCIRIEDKIEFNKEVRYINWKSTSEPAVTIECTDGSIYDADHVITTLSMGVLKERYITMFKPTLPVLKTNAIEGIGWGTVNKIYLEFFEPFWPKDWTGFSLMWTKKDQDEIRSNPDDNWQEDIVGYYTVDYKPNILCGWMSGENARRMERLSDEAVLTASMSIIRKFLKKWAIPDPIRMKRSQWHSNPHFRGSYSFDSLKTDLLNTSRANLAKPITNALGQPILHFAGEATHDHYYSTVHGAIEAGWREANRIIDLYKGKE